MQWELEKQGEYWLVCWNSMPMYLRVTAQLIDQHYSSIQLHKSKLNSVALVRKRTTPTERPPLVGEVSANLFG
jgi:hypothetical protein